MSNHDYIESLTQHIQLKQRRKAVFNKTFFIAFVGPFISTIILFALEMAGVAHPPSWVNWIMMIVFVPLITASLVIGQKKELVGAYGETILILIPTFVWLLGGADEAIKNLMYITFAIVVFGTITYAIGLMRRNNVSPKGQKATQILLRLGFVAASVAATVVISIVLLNWADFSLHLAPNEVNPETHEVGPNYTATPWIVFIAVVTVLVAMLLVVLGLVSNYERKHVEIRAKTLNKKDPHVKFVNETIMVNLKRPWYKRIFRRY